MHLSKPKSLDSNAQLGQLYSEHHGWLINWLKRRMASPDNAPDTAQDTWLRIMASQAHLGMRSPRAFLATTARRLLMDRARRQAIEDAYLETLSASWEQFDAEASPEQLLEAVQLLSHIAESLRGLGDKPRQAFLMRYLDGASHAQISEHLGVSKKMVQNYLIQAVLKCHMNMAEAE